VAGRKVGEVTDDFCFTLIIQNARTVQFLLGFGIAFLQPHWVDGITGGGLIIELYNTRRAIRICIWIRRRLNSGDG